MWNILKIAGIALVIFLLIDMVWLGLIAKNLYKNMLGSFMTPNVNWVAAIIFYVIFTVGLAFFVINPAIQGAGLMHALLAGAIFGFVCYATYDLTNLATLNNWPVLITVIDLAWGSFVSAATAALSYLVWMNWII